ncbi:MAG TPA: DUF2997 domain-containing protein [Pirellulales bacterium]
MASIEIIVSPKGETQVVTHGFAGDACRGASDFMERALGRATAEHLAPEFFQQATTSVQQTQKG